MRSTDVALQVLHRSEPDERLGVKLFGKLYQEASAYAIRHDGRLEVGIFDTVFARDALQRTWPEGSIAALYSNHPEGDMQPRAGDLENLAAMPDGTKLYIVCERRCVRWDG